MIKQMAFQTCSIHGLRYEDYAECPQCITERIQAETSAESLRLQRAQIDRKRWQHRSIAIRKDSDGKWVLYMKDNQRIEGLAKVLDWYGEQGWELVNLGPESWEARNVIVYRATFKRIVED